MLQLESTGQAYLIDHSTGSGDCLATSGKSNAPHSKVETNNPMAAPKVAAYPNPTDGLLYLQTEQGNALKINSALYDLAGRLVYSGVEAATLNLSTLPSGLYILHVKSETRAVQTFKILKQLESYQF